MPCRTTFKLAAVLMRGNHTNAMWKRRDVSEDSDKKIYLFDRIGGQRIHRHRKSGRLESLLYDLVGQGHPCCYERGPIIHHP